jgi:TonB family protein
MNVPVSRRMGGAFGVSAVLHVSLAIIAIVLLTSEAARAPGDTPPFPTKFVFISTPDAGGGGGGHPAPAPRQQQLEVPPHRQPVPVPITAVVTPPPQPTPVLEVPVETDAAKILRAAGLSMTTLAAAPGGEGRGRTAGRGDGDHGVGPGPPDRGFGEALSAGGDVTSPVLVKRVDPKYTSEAMVTKITGVVVLEAVVRADGTIGAVRVVKSLDAKFGLDRTATEAAKQWVFKPGTRRGQPVDVLVTLVLEFRLH